MSVFVKTGVIETRSTIIIMTVFARETTIIGTMTIETKRTIVEMAGITIAMGNAMRIGGPRIIEVGKPNGRITEAIGNLATSAYEMTVHRRTDAADPRITIDATTA